MCVLLLGWEPEPEGGGPPKPPGPGPPKPPGPSCAGRTPYRHILPPNARGLNGIPFLFVYSEEAPTAKGI